MLKDRTMFCPYFFLPLNPLTLKLFNLFLNLSSERAKICAARIAAFFAPSLPTDIVATGTPEGICKMEKKESIPLKGSEGKGTPMTGSFVLSTHKKPQQESS